MNLRNTFRAVAMVAAVYFSLGSSVVPAVMLSPGDILVADFDSGTPGVDPGGIFTVDPPTGDRTIVSGFGVGSGPSFSTPFGMAVTPDGDILVSDLFGGSIFRVDPTTGDRTRVSGPGVGAGPAFGGPAGIALGPGNSLIVTTAFTHSIQGLDIGDVYRVDLATGDRTTLSSSFLGIGTGPNLFRPVNVVIDANGQNLVSDFDRILTIDPLTGNRSLLSARLIHQKLLVDLNPTRGSRGFMGVGTISMHPKETTSWVKVETISRCYLSLNSIGLSRFARPTSG